MKKFAIKFQDDVQLNFLLDDRHEFLLTTKEVALGYGTSTENVRVHKHSNKEEFIEGKHFLTVSNSNAQKYNLTMDTKARQVTLWTKRGIIRLGFFIKSQRAKEFRDWCEDLIINSPQQNNAPELLTKDGKNVFNVLGGLMTRNKKISNEIESLKSFKEKYIVLLEEYNELLKKGTL